MTTMVVIGRVSPDQARVVVDKYFGNWKAMGPRPTTDLPPVPLNKPSVSIVPNASSLQDQVTLAETIGVTRSHPDYYKLQLGNHVLSGAFYATRLYRDLRENAGLVYTVESLLEAGKTRSTFEVFYACDPSNVAKARSLVVRNLHMMQTTPISHEELNRTKALLARQIPLAEANIEDVAEELLSLSVEGLPLNEPVHAAENYLAITPEQLRDAFAKWIRPDDFVQIIVGPNP
jgi:zinc protease